MRDLLTDPAWKEEDTGQALPDSMHGCSVALPTWDAVVGYEEKRDKVMRRLRSGYPRFLRNVWVERLVGKAKAELCVEGEEVLVLPTRASAQRAQRYLEPKAEAALRVVSYHGVQVVVMPERVHSLAWDYWRFSGEVVSSRQAADLLAGNLRDERKDHLLRRRLANLNGAGEAGIFVFASGMAAINAVLRALPGMRSGLKTLQVEFPYVDCLRVQEMFGNGVVFLTESEGESFDEALQRIRAGEFAGVFTEAPSNPLLRITDVARMAAACREGATPLVIDDSAAGVLNLDILEWADVLTTSLTKWASGRGDVMAGMATVRASSPYAAEMKASLASDAGEVAPLYVADTEILLSNLRGVKRRMAAVNRNGLALASYLSSHPAVGKVWHPSVTTRERYEQVMAKAGGYGGLLSLELAQPKKSAKFYDSLELSKGPGFGTEFTLVCPYVQLVHYHELAWAQGCGLSPHLIRVSCGIEPVDVLIGAFDRALAAL